MKRVLVFCALAVAAPAFAQTQPDSSQPAPAADYAPPVQHVNITDDDVVEGEFQRPGEEFISIRGRAKHKSLIRIRYAFIDEMLKSAESF